MPRTSHASLTVCLSLLVALPFTFHFATALARAAEQCVQSPSQMISWYAGDGDTRDLWGTSNGAPAGGVTFSAGRVGQAFSFDGVDDSVITNLNVQPTAMPRTTWEAWVLPTRAEHTARQTIFTNDDGGFDRGVAIEENAAFFTVYTGSGRWYPVAVTPKAWQHIAVVYTETSIEFYKNGVRYDYSGAPTNGQTVNNFTIGRNPTTGEAFAGLIDEVGVYGVALTPAEVQRIYQAGALGKCKPGLANCFGDKANYSTGDTPGDITTADFNKDGNLDLAVTNRVPNNVSILLGTPTGIFGSATNFPVGGTRPGALTSGDFNRDGNLDLATANTNTDNISVLFGTGTGAFSASTEYAVGDAPVAIVSLNTDSDDKLDLVVANLSSHNIHVLAGDGTGGFALASSEGTGTSPRSIATGDFDRDGKVDLAVSNLNSRDVSIMFGTGAGGFNTGNTLDVGSLPGGVAAGDFNSDGKTDIAVMTTTEGLLFVFPGNGDYTFAPPLRSYTATNVRNIGVGDFNSDGKLDFAISSSGFSSVYVQRGDGAGNFALPREFAVESPGNFTPAIGDFDRDGRLDIAAPNTDTGNVSILFNTLCGSALAPAADTYVKGATPTTNFGTIAEMQVKRTLNPGSGKGRQAYLRFETASLNTDYVFKATLRVYGRLNFLTSTNVNVPCAVFPVSNTTWSELGMTWNNKPAPTFPAELTRLIVTDANARWYEFDITNYVRDERAAGRLRISVLLRNMQRGETGDFYTLFNSREAADHRPQLVIEQ